MAKSFLAIHVAIFTGAPSPIMEHMREGEWVPKSNVSGTVWRRAASRNVMALFSRGCMNRPQDGVVHRPVTVRAGRSHHMRPYDDPAPPAAPNLL